MPPRTVTAAVAEALANLRESDFRKFCSRLLDRRTGPRVVRSRVDGKDYLDVTDVLVSTFTEDGALAVTLELLEDIECNQDARRLEQEVAALASSSSSSSSSRDQHFVDRHMAELVQRVTNTAPVLDELLQEGFVQREPYNRIRLLATTHDQMRALFSGPLSAGAAAKEFFYQSLLKHEKYLMEDLARK